VWYGGKGQIAHLIVPLLPPHEVYLEPFAGGLSVLFAKEPATLETINDVHGDLVNFYRVLRDPGQFAAFQRMAELTPYAREEYMACRREWRTETDPVKRAWMWWVLARMAYGGGGREGSTGFRASTAFSWGYRLRDRDGSAGRRFISSVDLLPEIHERLRGVQIENRDWRHVFEAYGPPGCCVYLDPPYVLETRTGGRRYSYEMDLQDHVELTDALLASPAMCVLSGYRHEAVHARLEAAGWERTDFDVKLNVAKRSRVAQRRIESIWRNPAAVAAWRRHRDRGRQLGLLEAAP
jgi:DNA adenine methylase